MEKPRQILIIEPSSELRFEGPFTSPVTSFMKLKNPTDKNVCFKIKTTAPKKYCVRPNSGILEPESDTEIAVSLQPFDFDPNEKSKHKFMVLTMVVPDGTFYNDSLWQEVKPECLMDSKLKCVFEMPVENEAAGDNPLESNPTLLEKIKKMEVKPSTKVKSATEFSPEVAKAASDIKNLRMEESSLRQENMELKDEIVRLRGLLENDYAGGRPSDQGLQKPNPSLSGMYIVLAVVTAIFGFLLGKFLF